MGGWYQRAIGSIFEVVALDEDDGTVELQHFDGTIEEIELEHWSDMLLVDVDGPEDWSGSVDIDPRDAAAEEIINLGQDWVSPLDLIDQME